jgi:hypothetical protein
MDLTLPTILRALADGGAALRALAAWSRRSKGDVRALVLELKDNLACLDLVAEDGVPLDQVIDRISVAEYERLARAGFDFNRLERKRIPAWPSLEGTALAAWRGKRTEELVDAIYARLRDLKTRYPHVREHPRYRWGVRVVNIRKRIWLLLKHVRLARLG